MGATSHDTCTDCVAGKSASAGSSSCTACQAGKYAAGPGFPVCQTCPWDSFSDSAGAHNCSNCTNDYCGVGEYRYRCPPGSTADGSKCLKCRTYRLCSSLPCSPVSTDAELEHTMFVDHGGYNDTCPEQCKPPYRADCLTGSPSTDPFPLPPTRDHTPNKQY